jgi:tetratricopeptide (TPR) repeat protein
VYLVGRAYFSDGDIVKTHAWVDQAIDLLERNDHSCLTNFSRLYSLKGLAFLLSSEPDYDESETFLQLAARWAQNKTEEISCLYNLGTLMWYKHTHGLRLCCDAGVAADVSKRLGLFSEDRGDLLVGVQLGRDTAQSGVDDGQAAMVRLAATEALSYWDEAINMAVSLSSATTVTPPSSTVTK